MAKKQSESVYRIVDVVGVSEKSWEDAGRRAVEMAASSLRDLRVAEVTQMDMKVEDGKVTAFIPYSGPDPDKVANEGAEGIAADGKGNVYIGDVTGMTLKKYVRGS